MAARRRRIARDPEFLANEVVRTRVGLFIRDLVHTKVHLVN